MTCRELDAAIRAMSTEELEAMLDVRDTLAEMATQCTAPPELWDRHANEVLALRDTRDALIRLLEVIRMAGLSNLTRGVQLGQTSWFVKASDAMEVADQALARCTA